MSDAQGTPYEHDVPGPNLTPLIDVGLLLVVFLLTSLRPTSFDRVIESRLPLSRSCGPAPREVPVIGAALDREDLDAPTTVRIGGHDAIALPGFDDPTGRRTAVEQIAAILEEAWATVGVGLDVHAAIRMRRPATASCVLHGDVVAVLDAFRRAGLERIEYEGSRLPFPCPKPD